jgi:hypothetical protein
VGLSRGTEFGTVWIDWHGILAKVWKALASQGKLACASNRRLNEGLRQLHAGRSYRRQMTFGTEGYRFESYRACLDLRQFEARNGTVFTVPLSFRVSCVR